MYKPAQHWLWDFWLVAEGQRQHLFYLQAPDNLGDAELRHARARIGHACSSDLREWQELGEVFGPARAAEWDDRCTWTGSIVQLPSPAPATAPPRSRYAMLYTGTNERTGNTLQQVGLAWSNDLQHWQRHQPSLILPHPGHTYLGSNPQHAGEQAWRDPDLHFDGQRRCFQALICAQQADASGGHGAIALAESDDLVHWRIEPPLYASAAFFLMEIPQRWYWGAYEYLLFSAAAQWVKSQHMGPAFAQFQPRTGTYYVYRERQQGQWQHGGLLWGSADQQDFGFKLLRHQEQCWGLYWRGYDRYGQFRGSLSDPHPVRQLADGRLLVMAA